MARLPITVGTDGSEPSLRAVDWAAGEAAARGLPLRIVSVPELPARTCAHHARALNSAAGRALAQQPGLTIDPRLLPGHPAQVLMDSSADAAMLVVGSWGAGTLSARFLGSVSQHVAAHARCLVVVVRDQAPPVRREIVVGIGDLDEAGPALEFAFEEAALRDAAVVAVHAWSWYLPTTGRQASMDPAERAALNTCCLSPDISARLGDAVGSWRDRYPGVPAEVKIPRGLPGRAITAASTTADLVVLGRWPTQRPSPGVRSVTHTVLHHAHAPVAVTAPALVPA
jgi:nucleotide-binding universal stress UspA family protein